MKLLPVLIIAVLAVAVESQLTTSACHKKIPEQTTFFLNRKSSNTTYTLTPVVLSVYRNLNKIDRKLPVKLIIHGWNQTAKDPLFEELTQAYLENTDLNVIRADYYEVAVQDFPIVLTKIQSVVSDISRFIVTLNRVLRIPLARIHLIGHSLGGQVSGLTGKDVIAQSGEKVGRITVLDAGRPAFESVLVADSRKLTKDDATRVEAIHTDANQIGLVDPVGHVDFYPNGGKRWQPNCVKSEPVNILGFTDTDGWKPVYVDDMFCSHQRCIRYFTKSVNTKIEATKCDSWENYQSGKCSNNQKVTFGEHVENDAEGVYYLDIVV